MIGRFGVRCEVRDLFGLINLHPIPSVVGFRWLRWVGFGWAGARFYRTWATYCLTDFLCTGRPAMYTIGLQYTAIINRTYVRRDLIGAPIGAI